MTAQTSCIGLIADNFSTHFLYRRQTPYKAMSLGLRKFWLCMCRGPLTTQPSNVKEMKAGSNLEECTEHSGITPLLGRALSLPGKHMLAHQGLLLVNSREPSPNSCGAL